jgi:hypothetical protein
MTRIHIATLVFTLLLVWACVRLALRQQVVARRIAQPVRVPAVTSTRWRSAR